jgi:hypothetical protein
MLITAFTNPLKYKIAQIITKPTWTNFPSYSLNWPTQIYLQHFWRNLCVSFSNSFDAICNENNSYSLHVPIMYRERWLNPSRWTELEEQTLTGLWKNDVLLMLWFYFMYFQQLIHCTGWLAAGSASTTTVTTVDWVSGSHVYAERRPSCNNDKANGVLVHWHNWWCKRTSCPKQRYVAAFEHTA